MAADTIFALSTGSLPSGIAIVRVSGSGVRFVLETLLDSAPEPRRAALRTIRAEGGSAIDDGLVLFFPAPGSFTGEDLVELHVHGGRAVVAAILDRLGGLPGLRAAEPGEFTRRAFVGGRIDLTQAEGLADLVLAETEAQRRQALRQAEGSLRALYEGWRERLVRARALLEAELDFSDEDDVPGSVSAQAWADVAAVAGEIGAHLDDGRRGERLREGLEIVVLGPPNAGKSSLINALARRDVAIVSAEPGTTRDLIEVRLDLGGLPATVVDTAGLREAAGGVEAEGMRRATARAERADVVLWLREMTDGARAAPRPAVPPETVMLRVGTKGDLIESAEERARLSAEMDLWISVRTGIGMEDLVERLTGLAAGLLPSGESPVVSRARHRSALIACRDALLAAGGNDAKALELRAEDLRQATDALGRLTGRVDVEDLLDVIFGEFCIGK